MAAAAVKLAERIFPSLARERVLLIGSGEMIELAATRPRRAVEVDHDREPHAEADVSSPTVLAPMRSRSRSFRASARLWRHRHVHGEHAAHPWQGTSRAGGEGAPARTDFHRSRCAARRRAGSCGLGRVPLQRRRPFEHRQGQPPDPQGIRVPGRSDDRGAGRGFVRWLDGRTVVPTITALQGRPMGCALPSSKSKMLAAGSPPAEVLEPSPAASPTNSCMRQRRH